MRCAEPACTHSIISDGDCCCPAWCLTCLAIDCCAETYANLTGNSIPTIVSTEPSDTPTERTHTHMAATKDVKGPEFYSYDLSTTAGFLAALDDQVQRLVTDKGWCQQGVQYAYDWSGVPSPSNRTQAHPLAGINPEWVELSPAGKAELAKVQATEQAKLPVYRAGVVRGMVYALGHASAHGRQFTQKDADTICDALSLERLVPVRNYQNMIAPGNSWVFTTTTPVTIKQQNALREAMQAAFDSAVHSVLPDALCTRGGTAHLSVGTQAERTWSVPSGGTPVEAE